MSAIQTDDSSPVRPGDRDHVTVSPALETALRAAQSVLILKAKAVGNLVSAITVLLHMTTAFSRTDLFPTGMTEIHTHIHVPVY